MSATLRGRVEDRDDDSTDSADDKWSATALGVDCDQIEPHLYVGDWLTAINIEALERFRIRRVLTVCQQPIDADRRSVALTYKQISVTESDAENLMAYFGECNEFIDESQRNGESVFVHCTSGTSRSATVVMAFLMNKYDMKCEDAIDLVRTKRQAVMPHESFVEQLELYEKMNYRSADARCREYRHYLVKLFAETLKQHHFYGEKPITNAETALKQYFQRLANANISGEPFEGREYECAECKTGLFREIHVMKWEASETTSETSRHNECHDIYIEPQHWMSKWAQDIGKLRGNLICCQCNQVLGEFDMHGFVCGCALHHSIKNRLVFKMDHNICQLTND